MALVLQKGLVITGGGGAVDSVNGKTGEVVLTGEDISADVSELTDTVQSHLQSLHDSLATRMDVDASNITETGKERIKQIADTPTITIVDWSK